MAKPKPELPIHITKNIGLSLRLLVVAGIIGLGYELLYMVGSGDPGFAANMSIDHITTCVLIILVVSSLFFTSYEMATIEIDHEGVSLSTRRRQFFYAWSDMISASIVRGRNSSWIRLNIRNRSDIQNRYNTISTRFGVDAKTMLEIMEDGITRWGQKPSDRKTVAAGDNLDQATSDALGRVLTPMALVMILLFAFVLNMSIADYFKTKTLQAHGQRMEATVDRIYTDNCGRHGCSLYVKYSFQASHDAQFDGKIFEGRAFLTGEHDTDDPDYQYARTKRTVPIAYDATDPRRSDLNFNDRVFSRDPLGLLVFMITTVGGMILGIFGLFAGVIWLTMKNAARKAGVSAIAT